MKLKQEQGIFVLVLIIGTAFGIAVLRNAAVSQIVRHIFAVFGLAWFCCRLVVGEQPRLAMIGTAFLWTGAAGNLIYRDDNVPLAYWFSVAYLTIGLIIIALMIYTTQRYRRGCLTKQSLHVVTNLVRPTANARDDAKR